jgi:hypothetical protein
MSELRTRLQKLQALTRLREFEKESAAFVHLRDQQVLRQKQQLAAAQQQRYEAAHTGRRLDPDSHAWRLAAIAVLRSAALDAAAQQQEAAERSAASRRELAGKRLEVRVAEHAEDATRLDVRREAERREQDELLDLQLFRKRAGA